MCRSSRMSGRKSAMPPSDSILKPWQNTTSETVSAASRRPGEGGGADSRDTWRSNPDRFLLHQRDLLLQLQDAILPVALGVEPGKRGRRSEEHTSELQSQSNLVCRLLLEKKKI